MCDYVTDNGIVIDSSEIKHFITGLVKSALIGAVSGQLGSSLLKSAGLGDNTKLNFGTKAGKRTAGLIVLGSAYVIPVASELKSIASDIRREDNEDSLVADILDGLGDALLETVYAIASLLLGGPVGTISSAITAIGIIAILL